MTSFAFSLGVLPLVLGQGAGAGCGSRSGWRCSRGMLGVTAFGLLFTPIFYVAIRASPISRPRRRLRWRGAPARSRPRDGLDLNSWRGM
jgi:hypothetical protein